MAEGGAHSGSCENAGPGSVCDCDCAGARHAVASTGGRPAASRVTERARRVAAADGRAVVIGDGEGGQTRTVDRRPRIPPSVLEQARRVRAGMPNTPDEWDALGARMPRNEHGRPMPTAEHQRHLDDMLRVGRGVLSAARAEFARDQDMQAARQRIGAFDAANDFWRERYRQIGADRSLNARDRTAAYNRLNAEVDQRRAAAGIGPGYFPGEDRRAVARRESEILSEMVAAARPMGGPGHTWLIREPNQRQVAHRGARQDAEVRLAEAESYYPDDWLERSRNYPLRLDSSDRAYYLNQGGGRGGILAMPSTRNDRAAYDGAFRDQTAEVTVHELGHRMETMVPGLTAMEYTMVRRRATNALGDSEEPIGMSTLGQAGYAANEVTFRDEWAHPYAGKTYEASRPNRPDQAPWELFQVGMQDTFGRGRSRFDTRDDLQAFTLGALLTLGRAS